MTRNSRYGLRGCRIGEASNPGPPNARIRPEGVSEAVIESLEEALTVVDRSDEEPLVRTMTGRHVVRRVGETEQRSVSSSMKLDEAVAIRILTNSQLKWIRTTGIRPKCQSSPSPLGSIGMQVMSRVLYLRNLVGAKWRI